jgi:hypothetical protein
MDQKNLAVMCKTLSDLKQPIPSFWQAANDRFLQLEHEFDLRNFSFIVFGFVNSGLLDESQFLKLTRKAILRNSEDLNWKDLPMILSVSEKLDFSTKVETQEYARFKDTIFESIDCLITQACENP